ncbi:GAF domain-containing protein [bacterium]|nr:GAF domain-containing protein [bacterium]
MAAGITPEIDNPELQDLDLGGLFPRWVAHFTQGEIVSGLVSDFPESERSILEPQQIVALVVMPIIVDGLWWGFIGFDECTGERLWTRAEIDLLRSVAGSLGGHDPSASRSSTRCRGRTSRWSRRTWNWPSPVVRPRNRPA